jgi:hypothetical protein
MASQDSVQDLQEKLQKSEASRLKLRDSLVIVLCST